MNEGKFSGRAAVYAAHRPGYPDALLDALFTEAGLRAGMAVADIGAGTGIFSQALLVRGCRVIAVEPNADMRAEAVARLGGTRGFTAVDGSAEATGLPEGSADAVVAAQAFHWFDRARFAAECRRILKPDGPGPVVLVWNSRGEDDPAVQAMGEVNRMHCPAFRGFSGGSLTADEHDIAGFFHEDRFVRRAYPFDIHQSEDEFVGRALSASYAPRPDDTAFGAYTDAVRKVFQRFAAEGPRLRTPMVCRVYWGRV